MYGFVQIRTPRIHWLSIMLLFHFHYIYIHICIYRLVPASGTTWGGGGGVGWDVNVHVTLRQDVNVHEPRKPELGW